MTTPLLPIILGILAVYLLEIRTNGRLSKIIKYPKENWRMLAFDLLACGTIGLLVTYYAIQPSTDKEAFLCGFSWESVALGFLNTRNATIRKKGAKQS